MNKELSKYTLQDLQMIEWQELINPLVENIASDGDIPDQVIKATEYLLSGYPLYKVAKELNTKQSTIKSWIKKYPGMALVLANGRALISKWRLAKLEQQYMKAIEQSSNILDLDMSDEDVNTKLVATIAQHSRYIIDLFSGKNLDIDIHVSNTNEDTSFVAKQEALDYVAEKLKEDGEAKIIDAEYRIIQKQKGSSAPIFDDKGNPNFGKLGEVETNDEGKVLCHICGKYYKDIIQHIKLKHDLDTDFYEVTFCLEDGALRKAQNGKHR